MILDIHLTTVKKAARRMGIAESTLRSWICQRRFPYVKVGRRTMVDVEDLKNFVDANRVPAQADGDRTH